MSPDRCARCGREHSEDEGVAGPEESGAWLWIDGQDICPRCQTPEEQREAERRIVEAVEREIARRDAEGIPPDEREHPVIEHALGIRSRAAAGDPEPDARSGSPDPGGARPRRLTVAVTGAFLTGWPLVVRLEDYGDLQRKLGGTLTRPRWRTEDLQGMEGTYRSGGGFTQAVPLTIARREGVDLVPWLAAALAPATTGAGAQPALHEVRPTSLHVDVYDLGIAVLVAWFDVAVAPGSGLHQAARAIKDLVWLRAEEQRGSRLAQALKDVAADVAQEYAAAVAAEVPEETQEEWLSRTRPETTAAVKGDARPPEQGRLLWLHPVNVLHSDADRTEHKAEAVELAPTFSETLPVEGGVFAPGVGWSSIVVAAGSDGHETPVRLTVLHWAYYALYMVIDRGLLGVLNQERWSRSAPLKQLEEDAEAVYADSLRVTDARARLDSALNGLGGDELAIWEAVSRVQRFDAVVDGVDRKLDALETVAKRRVDLATAERARRMTNILGGLTVLTVVTVAATLLGAFLGSVSPGKGSLLVRVAIVFAAVLVALCVYWFAYRRTMRPGGEATADRTGSKISR